MFFLAGRWLGTDLAHGIFQGAPAELLQHKLANAPACGGRPTAHPSAGQPVGTMFAEQ